ncbi:MAG: hypothetical protein M1837_004465 [Sclerophora amabilis]|nr:MAG: hypothetical protein M1837_004465 [Sclerophora amabilis]
MSNFTRGDLPPLPSYTTSPQPYLLPPIPDKFMTVLVPVAAYWILSLVFHYIDTYDYLSQYRLHTPAEVLKRNRVSRRDVIRDVVIQQVIQTVVGLLLGMTEPDDTIGREEYDISIWARRIRVAQRAIPSLLSIIGIDAMAMAKNMQAVHPAVAGLVSGGQYPSLIQNIFTSAGKEVSVPQFASWELVLARAMYWLIVPALQFALGVFVVDTWQYFLHRAMHMNQWLYRTFHARHHRLYVPYAFGALYNHPFEGFLLDTLGASIAFKVAGMTTRQGLWFFTISTIKTVDDHCGYALPWDPLQRLTSNNAGYHDVHHQSWGIKTNFSQPFFTFWDRFLGTVWTGGDVSARYARSRKAAEQHMGMNNSSPEPITHSKPEDSLQAKQTPYENELSDSKILTPEAAAEAKPPVPAGKAFLQAAGSRDQTLQDSENGGPGVLLDEAEEEKEAKANLRRSPRKKTASLTPQAGGLKNLRERVNGSLHGRGGAVLGLETSR